MSHEKNIAWEWTWPGRTVRARALARLNIFRRQTTWYPGKLTVQFFGSHMLRLSAKELLHLVHGQTRGMICCVPHFSQQQDALKHRPVLSLLSMYVIELTTFSSGGRSSEERETETTT